MTAFMRFSAVRGIASRSLIVNPCCGAKRKLPHEQRSSRRGKEGGSRGAGRLPDRKASAQCLADGAIQGGRVKMLPLLVGQWALERQAAFVQRLAGAAAIQANGNFRLSQGEVVLL